MCAAIAGDVVDLAGQSPEANNDATLRAAAARSVANSMIASSVSPLREPDIGRALSGSLGIALFPHHAADADSLSIAADRRRYKANSQGKASIRFAHG